MYVWELVVADQRGNSNNSRSSWTYIMGLERSVGFIYINSLTLTEVP